GGSDDPIDTWSHFTALNGYTEQRDCGRGPTGPELGGTRPLGHPSAPGPAACRGTKEETVQKQKGHGGKKVHTPEMTKTKSKARKKEKQNETNRESHRNTETLNAEPWDGSKVVAHRKPTL
ncbi:hypothetical protein DKP78_16185, partial [Enterococcus faecium]